VLYLAVSAAGCLLSAGRDDEAVGVLQGCAEVLTAVHEAGADAAVWHAATGVAKYHCNDLRVRQECLGTHVGPLRTGTCQLVAPACSVDWWFLRCTDVLDAIIVATLV
jgi:hypothetical protein